jgi:hypothetical protein
MGGITRQRREHKELKIKETYRITILAVIKTEPGVWISIVGMLKAPTSLIE